MKHLGGHQNITHIDFGVLSFLKEKLGCETLVDVGCGPAEQLSVARKVGYSAAIGIDGDPKMRKENVIIHDYTTGEYVPESNFDLAWSCEFVEHVEEKFVCNFMATFKKCDYVALTHALPGKAGHHHVNCRTSEYWVNEFKNAAFEFQDELTKEARLKSTMKRNFFRENGLIFKKLK
tara:strand:- start:40 stop:570 length:531 start_codon:yes stop_codon:yes gene_type:complete